MATFNGTVDKLEDNRNKVDDISSVTSEVESVKYPSVKAVKDHTTETIRNELIKQNIVTALGYNSETNIPSIETGVNTITGINSKFNLYYCKIGNIVCCYTKLSDVTSDPNIRSDGHTFKNILPVIPASSSTFTVDSDGSKVCTITLSDSNSNIVCKVNGYSYTFDNITFTYYTNS